MQQEALEIASEDILISLLPVFRQCKTYAERLIFWEEHNLTEHLYYCLPDELGCWYPAERSEGGYSELLSAITIAPFNKNEAQQFVGWALRVRSTMNNIPVSFEMRKANFLKKYYGYAFASKRSEYLDKTRKKTQRWVDGQFSYVADPELDLHNIDLTLLGYFFTDLTETHTVNLIKYIPISDITMDWRQFDVYLAADNMHQFAEYVEKFNPDNYNPTETSTTTNTDANETIELTHNQIALLHYYNGEAINKNNAETIAAKYGQTSGKRLEQIYKGLTSELSRTATGKYTIKNIETVIPLLTNAGLALATNELKKAIKNNKK